MLVTLLSLMLWGGLFAQVTWAGLDAYIVYAGKSKAEKKQLLKDLPDDLSVKAYNVDLLAVADYSGKQKVMAKIQRAALIVILHDGPMEILKGFTVKPNLIIVKSLLKTVQSKERTLYVLSKGTDLANLGKRVKTLEATGRGQLQDAKALESADAVVVDESALDILKALSVLMGTVLSE